MAPQHKEVRKLGWRPLQEPEGQVLTQAGTKKEYNCLLPFPDEHDEA